MKTTKSKEVNSVSHAEEYVIEDIVLEFSKEILNYTTRVWVSAVMKKIYADV